MKNYVQPGDVMTFTAPAGGVVSGTPVKIGQILVVPAVSAAQGAAFEGQVVGVFELPKAGSQAWTEGQRVYWDEVNARCDSDPTVGQLIGVAAAAVDDEATSTTGTVRLNGVAPAMSEGPQAAQADLVDNSGGAEADGIIALVTAPNLETWDGASVFPTATQGSAISSAIVELTNAVKELSTAHNALLAKLRAAGIIAAS